MFIYLFLPTQKVQLVGRAKKMWRLWSRSNQPVTQVHVLYIYWPCCTLITGPCFVFYSLNSYILSLQYGTTPLIWAARKGHYDCVMHLLANGADVDQEGAVSGSSGSLLVAFIPWRDYIASCEQLPFTAPSLNTNLRNGCPCRSVRHRNVIAAVLRCFLRVRENMENCYLLISTDTLVITLTYLRLTRIWH